MYEKNKYGNPVASSIYIYKIEAEEGDKRAVGWGKCAVVK